MLRDGDGGRGGGAHLVFAYYINSHDVGQATRALQVVEHLLAAGHHVHVVTAAPELVRTTEIASPRLHIREVEQVVLECGAPNALTVDRFPSVEKYCDNVVMPRESILRSEAKWLKSIEADIVASDVGCAVNGSAESSPQPFADAMTSLKSLSGLVVNGSRSPKNQTREKALLPDCRSPHMMDTCERTPSPPSKRLRGRSVPPTPADNSDLELPAARRRSSSSPPTPDRKRSEDETIVIPKAEDEIIAIPKATPVPPTAVYWDIENSEDETVPIPKATHTPMTVYWDIENCTVPNNAQVEEVCKNMRDALQMNFSADPITIKAYGASNKIREGLQRTGVTVIDIQNRKKNAADKLILVDMILFAVDNPKSSSILLISGDGDFTLAVQQLVQRGYTVRIAIPSLNTASSSLMSAGSSVCEWPVLARGLIVIPKSLPDSLDVLKAQMIQLFLSNGGHMDLVRIVPAYMNIFGKQLRLANYGVSKLIDLFLTMGNPFFVIEGLVILDMQSALEDRTTDQKLDDPASTTISSDALGNVLCTSTEDDV
ncbi:hypothetical protein BDA96_04G043500 [Sorghum bicolor]|uniref:HTH OST-type domain-containing protein n=1 Tax=Sorghum bicolor TaxID=4558 RepID=A0A921UHC9_SORBI|nr:hypothetical protein BDA96_04G043500 [Sorghum bicolor]